MEKPERSPFLAPVRFFTYEIEAIRHRLPENGPDPAKPSRSFLAQYREDVFIGLDGERLEPALVHVAGAPRVMVSVPVRRNRTHRPRL